MKTLVMEYGDYASRQRKLADGGMLDRGLAYWKEELRGSHGHLGLPTDRLRPAVLRFAADEYQMTLPIALVSALKRLTRQHQATLYMTLLGGFMVLLARYSGQDDIVVGTPIANRKEKQ